MANSPKELPLGKTVSVAQVVRTSAELGTLARAQRQHLGLKQDDVAGLGNTGTRFVSELERGKPTTQLQMALDLLDLIGLEVVVQTKSGGRP
jgi:HTH-type transcriptional regulator/antitoxin HipB